MKISAGLLKPINRSRTHNDQKKKDKRSNNDVENITHKTKDGTSVKSLNNSIDF